MVDRDVYPIASSPEEGPALPGQLDRLFLSVEHMMGCVPNATTGDPIGAAFYGWRSGVPVYDAQPTVDLRFPGVMLERDLPEAAKALRLRPDDKLEFNFSPLCFEGDELVKPIASLTITRAEGAVEADVYVMEGEVTKKVSEATHTQQTREPEPDEVATLLGNSDAFADFGSSYSLADLAQDRFVPLADFTKDEEIPLAITTGECMAIQIIVDTLAPPSM